MDWDVVRVFMFVVVSFFSFELVASTVYQAKVVGITDGDTIKVLLAENEQVKVRLAGIDCPERSQPWGDRAKEAVSDLVAMKGVTVEVMDIDRYGRTIGRVFIDGSNVNRALVEAGHCWAYTRYVRDEQLFLLEARAQNNQRGLWALPEKDRMPPWEWRKRTP